MRSLRTWWTKRPPLILRRFLDGVSGWCEFDLEARMPVRDIRRRAPPVALCRAHRRNRAQPHQSGRCAARNCIHQLAETDLDLLRTLRGVYLRRSFVSIDESGRNARTKRMTKETLNEVQNAVLSLNARRCLDQARFHRPSGNLLALGPRFRGDPARPLPAHASPKGADRRVRVVTQLLPIL